jgi:hypothetical protein
VGPQRCSRGACAVLGGLCGDACGPAHPLAVLGRGKDSTCRGPWSAMGCIAVRGARARQKGRRARIVWPSPTNASKHLCARLRPRRMQPCADLNTASARARERMQ